MNRVVSGNRLHSNVSRHCFGLWKMNEYFGGNSEELFDIIFHSKHEHSHHRSIISVGQKALQVLFSSAQSFSRVRLFAIPWTATHHVSVHHQLQEFTQTHVYWVSVAIQPSHPLSSPYPPAHNLSQHQGLFKWVSSSHQVAKVLEFQLQHQSFQWIFRSDFFLDGLVGSPCCPRNSKESSPTLQFKSTNSSVLSFHYSPTLTSIHDYWKKP